MSNNKHAPVPLSVWFDAHHPKMTDAEIGRMFGFSQTAIWNMRNGKKGQKLRKVFVTYLRYDPNHGHIFKLSEEKVLGIGSHPYME